MKIKIKSKLPQKIIAVDYKSGKVSLYPAPLQLIMYVVYLFIKYPSVNEIKSLFLYIEHNEEKVYTFKRKYLNALKSKVIEKIVEIEKEEIYPKKEGPLCNNYCDFRKAGLCDPETQEEFQDKMFKMIKPYKRKKR